MSYPLSQPLWYVAQIAAIAAIPSSALAATTAPSVPEKILIYGIVFVGFTVIAIASTMVAKVSRHTGLMLSFLVLGALLIAVQIEGGGISSDFVVGYVAGGCAAVAGVLALAASMSRRRRGL
ncbi:hypothetical protein [Methylorubrum extorquens]|uniref:Uncharacterized protein n=1 Tax=Methylorubrum extorquens TaxID=408 RepID=A0AAX3WG56_METEX|nr:hypothetical protein [Methylorubrum extorquens]WHQ69476.1 hypothetical protein KEC54_24570 [Methylorubrum extorquens]